MGIRKTGFVVGGLGTLSLPKIVGRLRGCHTQMYGETNRADFRCLEGFEDHSVEVLCFWNERRNTYCDGGQCSLPCAGSRRQLCNQRRLLARGGENLLRANTAISLWYWGGSVPRVDQFAAPQFRKMLKNASKMRGLTRLQEIAKRIDAGWEEAMPARAKTNAPMSRSSTKPRSLTCQDAILPRQNTLKPKKLAMLTNNPDSAADIELERAGIRARLENKTESTKQTDSWYRSSIERYEQQKGRETSSPIRRKCTLSDWETLLLQAINSNCSPNSVFRRKARSPAIQTFRHPIDGCRHLSALGTRRSRRWLRCNAGKQQDRSRRGPSTSSTKRSP